MKEILPTHFDSDIKISSFILAKDHRLCSKKRYFQIFLEMLSLAEAWTRTPSYVLHRVFPISASYRCSRRSLTFDSKVSKVSISHMAGREIDLLDTKDIRFRLPGNVGLFINNDWLHKFRKFNKIDSIEAEKNDSFIKISPIKLMSSLNEGQPVLHQNIFFEINQEDLYCEAHECPLLLVKDFQELFPHTSVNLSDGLTVLTIVQKTENDMSNWSREIEKEREKLLSLFVSVAQKMCNFLKQNGYWADFIDPSSGRPYYVIFSILIVSIILKFQLI